MFLVVGLGNPEPKYARNRHNVGFMVVDHLADRWRIPAFREKFQGEFAKASHAGEDVVLLKPMTYMNLSGECVQRAMTFFKVPTSRILVIHDELDLPFAALRLKTGGGYAGHNGLKSVAQHCGGGGYHRLRIGIGRPPSGQPEGWVLSDFSSNECAELPDLLDKAAEAVEMLLKHGPQRAMNRVHAP